MDDFQEELFACPECTLKTRVVWDPGQEKREIDCIHCRRDVTDMVVALEEDGTPKTTLNKQGETIPLLEPNHYKTGCRYKIQRGKGVK